MAREQLFKNCSLEVRQWVGNRKPGTLEEAIQLADEYLENRVQSQPLTLPLSPTNHSCETDHTHALHASHVTGVTECQVQDAQETGPHIYRKQQVNIDASDLKEFRVSAVNLCDPKRWENNCAPRRGHRGVLKTRLEHQTKLINPTPIHSNRNKLTNSPNCKVYIGNLGKHGHKTILEQAFGYYGPLHSVWVVRSPPDKIAIRSLNPHANGSQHKGEYGLRETTMSPKDFTEPAGPSKCSRDSPYKGDPQQCTYSGGEEV
ncbi:hypothetical protein XELAEV_18000169mg [Xenopus laevis]|uniref:RRM domain-containing protein n=1 Tax=Xenopus laevis TaxID=8355 RepID=A0A974GZI6_XENLA|nr:hypothetical protein XELAEV_18000169mg [Xenopus laevis]